MKDSPKQKNNPSKLDKFIDGAIAAFKIAGSSDLFLGIFLILEGISLAYVRALFPVFVVLSIIIAFAFAIEWFFDIIRHRRTVWSVLQQICITLILVALAVYCFLMIFDDLFRLNVDRVLVCATTIADGIKNLIHTIKVEKSLVPRIFFIILSIMYINYGVAYCLMGGGEISIFNTLMHGAVFTFCGATNIWLYYRDPENKERIAEIAKKREKFISRIGNRGGK